MSVRLIERAGFLWRLLLEEINFLVTNRIPRRLSTRFMGWFSRIEHPLIARPSLAVWKLCAPRLHLQEARKARFTSIHDCFTRALKEGARPIDDTPGVIVSPCDGIVGACGTICGNQLFQAKGCPYTLEELLCDANLAATFRNGRFVTLRLTPSMYHRFHAPSDAVVHQLTYLPGDTWNVNPVALRRVARLYCRNERAVIPMQLIGSAEQIALVPVAAILVASLQLTFVDIALGLSYEGPRRISCAATVRKGEELGYFGHGSTIVLFATAGIGLCETVRLGRLVRAGEPLLRHASYAITGVPTGAS